MTVCTRGPQRKTMPDATKPYRPTSHAGEEEENWQPQTQRQNINRVQKNITGTTTSNVTMVLINDKPLQISTIQPQRPALKTD